MATRATHISNNFSKYSVAKMHTVKAMQKISEEVTESMKAVSQAIFNYNCERHSRSCTAKLKG